MGLTCLGPSGTEGTRVFSVPPQLWEAPPVQPAGLFGPCSLLQPQLRPYHRGVWAWWAGCGCLSGLRGRVRLIGTHPMRLAQPHAAWLRFAGLPGGQSSRPRAPQAAGTMGHVPARTRRKAGAVAAQGRRSTPQVTTLRRIPATHGNLVCMQCVQRRDSAPALWWQDNMSLE